MRVGANDLVIDLTVEQKHRNYSGQVSGDNAERKRHLVRVPYIDTKQIKETVARHWMVFLQVATVPPDGI